MTDQTEGPSRARFSAFLRHAGRAKATATAVGLVGGWLVVRADLIYIALTVCGVAGLGVSQLNVHLARSHRRTRDAAHRRLGRGTRAPGGSEFEKSYVEARLLLISMVVALAVGWAWRSEAFTIAGTFLVLSRLHAARTKREAAAFDAHGSSSHAGVQVRPFRPALDGLVGSVLDHVAVVRPIERKPWTALTQASVAGVVGAGVLTLGALAAEVTPVPDDATAEECNPETGAAAFYGGETPDDVADGAVRAWKVVGASVAGCLTGPMTVTGDVWRGTLEGGEDVAASILVFPGGDSAYVKKPAYEELEEELREGRIVSVRSAAPNRWGNLQVYTRSDGSCGGIARTFEGDVSNRVPPSVVTVMTREQAKGGRGVVVEADVVDASRVRYTVGVLRSAGRGEVERTEIVVTHFVDEGFADVGPERIDDADACDLDMVTLSCLAGVVTDPRYRRPGKADALCR